MIRLLTGGAWESCSLKCLLARWVARFRTSQRMLPSHLLLFLIIHTLGNTLQPPFVGNRDKVQQKIIKDKLKLPSFLSSEAHSLLKGVSFYIHFPWSCHSFNQCTSVSLIWSHVLCPLHFPAPAQGTQQAVGQRPRRQQWDKEPQVVQANQLEEAGGPADPAKLSAERSWAYLHCQLRRVLDEDARAGLSGDHPRWRRAQPLRRLHLRQACADPWGGECIRLEAEGLGMFSALKMCLKFWSSDMLWNATYVQKRRWFCIVY